MKRCDNFDQFTPLLQEEAEEDEANVVADGLLEEE